MSENNNEFQPTINELLLVTVVLEPEDNENTKITFRSQSAEEILIQLCKEDPDNWNLFKKVVNDTLDRIEAAASKE